MIWRLVYRHSFTTENDAVTGLDDLALWACNVDTAAIQVSQENSREPQQGFGKRDVHSREQIVA